MKEYKLNQEQVQQLVDMAIEHNQKVDYFVKVTLKDHFGSETITAGQWSEAQHLISQQKFYERGMTILNVLRNIGIDCKMDMQSNKLHCLEYGIKAY